MQPLLRVSNVSKTFGTLPVLQQLSFEIQPGEVVGLTGSIGSGKSVLVMMLAGLYEPNMGSVHFDQRQLVWPFSAQRLGIGIVHQRPSLVDHLDVISNVFLGNELGRLRRLGPLKILDELRMAEETNRILGLLGVHLPSLQEKVSNLSIQQRQMIAVARVLTQPYRLIIIDEPTVLLSYPHQQTLLGLIQKWREQGVAVLFSSNNLDHLFAATDRIIVLNQGRSTADLRTDETSREEVVSLLLGFGPQPATTPTLWDFDSFDRFRENAERLLYHQMLVEKDLAAEDSLNRQLTKQLAEQVHALEQANLALIDAQRRLLSEREQERKHLARELHDEIIQDLLSVNYDLETLATLPDVSPGLSIELDETRESLRDLVSGLRQICGALRPPTIDSLGLGAALQSHSRDWSARTGIPVTLEIDPNLGRLPEATELSIFRIVQEGLNNVRKHARATQVSISLLHTSPRTLMVSLRDDGLGLAEDIDISSLSMQGHYGLAGIGERVALLGGRFRLQKLAEGGSLLAVEIPHPRVELNQEPVL
jgi:signal transduction histidine kinase